MTYPNITILYDAKSDANFRLIHGTAFEQWIRNNEVRPNEEVVFDQALVMFVAKCRNIDEYLINTNRFYARNGLHGRNNVGADDPDPSPHATVQMTNPALRSQGAWYVLHWRPGSGSILLRRPNNTAKTQKARARGKVKKARRRQRDKEANSRKYAGGDGSGAAGATAAVT